jgi:predicted AAA+ superfamily ATPase
MIVTDAELYAVLRQFNPWWGGGRFSELPGWRRAAFAEIASWAQNPPGGRALVLSGARQVGKTTLFLQIIDDLLNQGIRPQNIIYATFDHPLLKLVGVEKVLQLWEHNDPPADGPQYLFLDEIQVVRDWQTWLKLQVDFEKRRRIAVTGSATPLSREGQESGVGRWHTVRLATLSFYEHLNIRKLPFPQVEEVSSLAKLFDWTPGHFLKVAQDARSLVPLFNDYVLRGGFPQVALQDKIETGQRLLREDIVDKVLKRDMTALFGVRRVVELEQVFLYLCLHNGGILDLPGICKELQLKRPTVASFIDLLEATHLVYRLLPFGYGKEVLRGRAKIYLADPAIGPSVLLKGKALLQDDTGLGMAVETAFFKHVFTRYYRTSVGFSYWRDRSGAEVDIIADVAGRLVPFEVKYRSASATASSLKGLREFCRARGVQRAYVITKDIDDFGIVELTSAGEVLALKIPAPLACFWLGRTEIDQATVSE